MQDLLDYALKNGIILQEKGNCQFCGAEVTGGVIECHNQVHHLADMVDFNNPAYYVTRFLSVDAMALQHGELHGPWNNHIHLTRLHLILKKKVTWTYAKTPLLSNIINQYKKNKTEVLTPPPLTQRGNLTTSDLIKITSPAECVAFVRQWAQEVYTSFNQHQALVATIADEFLVTYY